MLKSQDKNWSGGYQSPLISDRLSDHVSEKLQHSCIRQLLLCSENNVALIALYDLALIAALWVLIHTLISVDSCCLPFHSSKIIMQLNFHVKVSTYICVISFDVKNEDRLLKIVPESNVSCECFPVSVSLLGQIYCIASWLRHAIPTAQADSLGDSAQIHFTQWHDASAKCDSPIKTLQGDVKWQFLQVGPNILKV